MQRILLSLGMIVFVGALAAGATGAFFNDTETSTGNTFAAGDIDLKIDNESYAIDFNIPGTTAPTGALVANPANSWEAADLTNQKFFNFTDVKPGDYGEDTISIHVGSNNAWMCAAARVTIDSDETCTEPENAAIGGENNNCVPGVDALTGGELDSELKFAFWVDDGDNVYEPVAGQNGGVAETLFLQGSLEDMNAAGQIALAQPGGGAFGNNPIPGNTTVYIGKMWCAGTMTPGALVQDGLNTGSPLTLGTGFTCNGATMNNSAQTDKVVGDMEFYATQSRNNPTFSCAQNYTPTWAQID